jgi:hypothetical protein
VIGDLGHMRDMSEEPYYDIDEKGQLQYYGTFAEGRPILTPLLKWLSSFELLRRWDVNYPSTVSEKSERQVCAVLGGLRDAIRERLPETRFRVVVYPGETLAQGYISKCFEKQGIEYIDAHDILGTEDRSQFTIPYDGHPNSRLTTVLAEFLASQLGPESTPSHGSEESSK